MTNSQPPLPQPQLKPAGITFDQYLEFTPEKLELADGFYGYGGQDQTGFQLAVLTNMGLLKAIRHTLCFVVDGSLGSSFTRKVRKS